MGVERSISYIHIGGKPLWVCEGLSYIHIGGKPLWEWEGLLAIYT